jgi:ubiquinone/menaquinone biosynthesis C-methylase UbiE
MKDISYVMEKVQAAFLYYNWNFYKTLDNLKEQRTLALTKFLSDYVQGQKEKRYLKAELPCLPFEDGSFDLVLSGHFLFTYANKFDFEFHKKSVLELYRISSGEVRIYPIQQRSSQIYAEFNRLLSMLKEYNIAYKILKVPFEFQKGSNKML